MKPADETDDEEGALQKGLREKEDEDGADFQYSIHDPKVKLNKMKPFWEKGMNHHNNLNSV